MLKELFLVRETRRLVVRVGFFLQKPTIPMVLDICGENCRNVEGQPKDVCSCDQRAQPLHIRELEPANMN